MTLPIDHAIAGFACLRPKGRGTPLRLIFASVEMLPRERLAPGDAPRNDKDLPPSLPTGTGRLFVRSETSTGRSRPT